MNKFLPYGKQSISASDKESVQKSLGQELITRGSQVEQFEKDLCRYTGAEFAVAFNSGSTALDAAYFAADGGPGDRLLTTPNTFISTLGAGVKRGMQPFFVDIDRDTGNIDLSKVIENLHFQSSRGRQFITCVHFSGIACDMKKLSQEIFQPDTVVIEDAAHAIGSSYPSGEKVGCSLYSDMTIFSFHPLKTITTGEGGAVLTNNKNYYERLKLFRNNMIVKDLGENTAIWNYDVGALSSNYHMNEMEAALGISQLKRIDKFIEKRRKLVSRYRKNLKNEKNIRLFTDKYDQETAFHLFVVQLALENRTAFMENLRTRNVGSQLHYIPLYRFSFLNNQFDPENYPEMEGYFASALSLPLYYELEESDVDYVCELLRASG